MTTMTQVVAQYGYSVVALCILLECIGVPLPGETALLVAAAAAGAGHLRIGVLILIAALAAIVGDSIGYAVGRQGGRAVLTRYGRYVRLDATTIARLEAFFAKHGPKAVFFGRFVGVLRTYTAFFAGLSRMHYPTFARYNALGGLIWASVVGMLGYVFGQNLPLIERLARDFGVALLIGVAVVVVAVLAWRWAATHRDLLAAQRDWLLANPLIAAARQRYARQLQWLVQRLTPGGYLGLHVTLGLAASMGFLWLLGGLAEDLLHNDPLMHVDQSFATTLHSWATPSTTAIFTLITQLGGPVLVVVGLGVAAVYAFRRAWLHVGTWVIALGGGEALNLVLKNVFERARPTFPDRASQLLVEQSYSFPSGHAMASFIVYGTLAYFGVLVVRSWRARTALVSSAAVLVLLIGFSRLYLGVHYLSDVLAGFAAGGVWLTTCITGMELVRRGEISKRWQERLARLGKRQALV